MLTEDDEGDTSAYDVTMSMQPKMIVAPVASTSHRHIYASSFHPFSSDDQARLMIPCRPGSRRRVAAG
jgi:hypothetical protein